ncbi:MAG: hypothetical protein KC431_21565, partial [Myxococcales bacterium]|nr:hypothetical protein [Myxococcales bacterium]
MIRPPSRSTLFPYAALFRSLDPLGREQVLAEVERRVLARALLGSSAYGIARVETDGVVSINVTHESGYTTAAALKSGRHLCGGRVTPSGRPSSA